MDTAQQLAQHPLGPIDPEFAELACRLVNCAHDDLLAVAWQNHLLLVITHPHTRYAFSAQNIFDSGVAHGRHQLDAPAEVKNAARVEDEHPSNVAALKAVAAAHPGELAVAQHKAAEAADQRPAAVTPEAAQAAVNKARREQNPAPSPQHEPWPHEAHTAVPDGMRPAASHGSEWDATRSGQEPGSDPQTQIEEERQERQQREREERNRNAEADKRARPRRL